MFLVKYSIGRNGQKCRRRSIEIILILYLELSIINLGSVVQLLDDYAMAIACQRSNDQTKSFHQKLKKRHRLHFWLLLLFEKKDHQELLKTFYIQKREFEPWLHIRCSDKFYIEAAKHNINNESKVRIFSWTVTPTHKHALLLSFNTHDMMCSFPKYFL